MMQSMLRMFMRRILLDVQLITTFDRLLITALRAQGNHSRKACEHDVDKQREKHRQAVVIKRLRAVILLRFRPAY